MPLLLPKVTRVPRSRASGQMNRSGVSGGSGYAGSIQRGFDP